MRRACGTEIFDSRPILSHCVPFPPSRLKDSAIALTGITGGLRPPSVIDGRERVQGFARDRCQQNQGQLSSAGSGRARDMPLGKLRIGRRRDCLGMRTYSNHYVIQLLS